MDDRGRLYLRLSKALGELDGTKVIKINTGIRKQMLRLTSYTVTATNQNLIVSINILFNNINNTSHLIDNSPSDVNFQLDCSNSTTQTFVPICEDYFNMNAPLEEYFRVKITNSVGGDLPADAIVTLKFLFDQV